MVGKSKGVVGIKLQQGCGRARGRRKLGHEKLSKMNERIFIGMAVIGCLVGMMVVTWQYQVEKCFNVDVTFLRRNYKALVVGYKSLGTSQSNCVVTLGHLW